MPVRRRLPEVSSLVYVSRDSVDFATISKDLTVEYGHDSLPFDMVGDDGRIIKDIILYDDSRPGLIGVPRHYFFSKIGGIALDRTVRPKFNPALFPRRVVPRDAEQAVYMAKISRFLQSVVPTQSQANAGTGTGKTAATIGAIAETGIYPTLIAVDTNALKEQWLGSRRRGEGFRYFMGDEWTERNVGIIQQDRCDFQDKLVMIGMMPSMVRRSYPQAFYDYIAAVAIDEVHVIAAPTLADFLNLLKPHVLFGMTATEKEGPTRKIIRAHIGPPAIISKQKPLAPRVFEVTVTREQAFYDGASRGQLITALSRLEWRNDYLARLIHHRGVLRRRNVLIIGDRVKQIQNIRDRLVAMGFDPQNFGLFVGEYETGQYRISIRGLNAMAKRIAPRIPERFPTRARAFTYARNFVRDNEILEAEINVLREVHKPTPEELGEIKENPKYTIIGATYAIFEKAMNVPRLDMGVELTPRGNVKQAIGRVTRVVEGKPTPEWYSTRDNLFIEIEIPIPGRDEPMVTKQYQEELLKLAKQRHKSYRMQEATVRKIGGLDLEILYH